jgi:hypothetical protein
MRIFGRTVYLVLGALALGLGLLALMSPGVVLPPEARSALTAHLVREQGAGAVFIGIMAVWCVFNFDSRRPVHLALLAFAALFAGIHWVEYFHGRRHLASPLLNSIPFLALLAVTPRRALAEPAIHR